MSMWKRRHKFAASLGVLEDFITQAIMQLTFVYSFGCMIKKRSLAPGFRRDGNCAANRFRGGINVFPVVRGKFRNCCRKCFGGIFRWRWTAYFHTAA